MARKGRILGAGESYYHITTRVVDKIFRFTKEENLLNVELLRRVEEFSCVQILSYCFMSNHLHILLRVPVQRKPFTEDELLDRIKALYGERFRKELKKRWEWARERNDEALVNAEKASYLKRMFKMSEFMKTLKQRLTMSYNGRYDRDGTLWESRYKSILLEGMPKVLSAVAAYIDLNPVRAKMVSDPAAYEFSSYGEACRGKQKAREGLCRIYQEGRDEPPEWKDVAPVYRSRLVMKVIPDEEHETIRFSDIQRALDGWGHFKMEEILCHKSKFFTTGFAFGCTDFIRQTYRECVKKKAASPSHTDTPKEGPPLQQH